MYRIKIIFRLVNSVIILINEKMKVLVAIMNLSHLDHGVLTKKKHSMKTTKVDNFFFFFNPSSPSGENAVNFHSKIQMQTMAGKI